MDKGTHDEVKTRYEGSFWNFSDKNTGEIQREIQITRADLDETVNALQARLAPQHMFNHIMDLARDNIKESAPQLAETIRHNPLPTAIAAIGLGWLFYRSINPAPVRITHRYGTEVDEYGIEGQYSATEGMDMSSGVEMTKEWTKDAAERVKSSASKLKGQAKDKAGQIASSTKEKAGQIADATREKAGQLAGYTREKAGQIAGATRDKAGQLVDYTKEKMGEWAEATKEKASDLAGYTAEKAGDLAQATKHGLQSLGHTTKVQVSRAGQGTAETFRDYPLAFGIACLGLGAAVALSLPTTRKEQELMGEASGNLVEKAKETGQEALQKLQHVAQAGEQAVKEQAQRENMF